MMFLSSRYVPSKPPSLVRFNSCVRADKEAVCTSAPMSDQVPELIYAQLALPVLAVGTPATAEAVSWAGGAMILTLPRPVFSVTPGRSRPRFEPGGTISGKMRAGRPNFFRSPVAQSRVSGFRHWEVEAMVNSATSEPHSAQ